ncbi:protein takeout-like [Sitophilus oryzae]|uniref:Protein takeout-like n=1 Tax=Sitophilus oryzae TaxID=7048 RepID=A0A6J2X8V2_SITOR|nr:protein takeout-like [Sitophilus oryzae]
MMNRMRLTVFVGVLASCCILSECAKLPSSWGRCHKSDKDFSTCLRKNVEDAIRKLRYPTPELGMNALDPLDIPELYIGQGKGPVNVAQHFKNVKLFGLTNVDVQKVNVDFEKNQLVAQSTNPELRLQGDYDMKGRVLLLPIYGQGPCNVTLLNMKILHTLTWEKIQKKGKTFLKPVDFKVSMEPDRVIFKFDNLFDGQKELGDNINKVLNDAWDEVFGDVKPGYEKSFGLIFKDLASRILTRVAEDEVFLE